MRYLTIILILFAMPWGFDAIAQSPDITQLEYYFDNDPGFGNGTQVAVSPDSITSTTFDFDISSLSAGRHYAFVRAQDANGSWSFVTKIIIEKVDPLPPASTAPDMAGIEYFFDTDPGFGNGVPVTVNDDPITSTTFDIDISGLAPGFHKAYFRSKDDNGSWSFRYFRNVFINDETSSEPMTDIVAMEYYFDTDPGFGNGTSVALVADTVTYTAFEIDISGLAPGFHKAYFRTKNENDAWSLCYFRNVFILDETSADTITDIVAMEYYFDTDPGFGNGTSVVVVAGTVTSTAFTIDVSFVDEGFHKVYFRTKVETGKWGLPLIKNIFKVVEGIPEDSPDIVAMEYFIDTDPGIGNGAVVPLIPGSPQDFTIDVDISGVSAGAHDMYVRMKDENNIWSLITVSPFEVSEVELTAYLEGPYNGNDMNETLNSNGNLPLNQPFNVAPWNYAGTESVVAIPNANVVDWVLLETRKADDAASATATTISSRYAAFLLNDGSIVDLDGTSNLKFNTYADTTNYVVIHHRNHLGILSAEDLNYSGSSYSYDFTTAAGQAHNSGQKDLGGGAYGLYTGDGNAEGTIDADDISTVWTSDAGNNGYLNGDFDMNGEANNSDKNDNWLPNNTIGSEVPD